MRGTGRIDVYSYRYVIFRGLLAMVPINSKTVQECTLLTDVETIFAF